MNRLAYFIFLVLFLFFNFATSFAQIEGLIIDKTKTKIGRDFFEMFYISIESIMTTEVKLDLTIEEFFDPQFGSRIFVFINENLIYQNFVSSRYDDIEEKAKEASNVAKYFIHHWKEYEKYLEEEGKIR